MMHKSSGEDSTVKVFLGNNLDEKNRFFMSHGVVRADGQFDVHNEKQYATNTYRPKDEWHAVTESDLDKIVVKGVKCNLKNNIGVFGLPADLKGLFQQLDLGGLSTLDEAKVVISSNKELFASLNSALQAFIKSFENTSIMKPFIHGIFYVKPGLETIGTRDGKYIGLHIDNGHAVAIDNLAAAPNRICINLGKQDRSLLFIENNSTDILHKLQDVVPADFTGYKEMHLASDFLSLYTDSHIIKVTQRPFEAYIAPTDHIIHDGSTVGMTQMDVTLVVIGEFNM